MAVSMLEGIKMQLEEGGAYEITMAGSIISIFIEKMKLEKEGGYLFISGSGTIFDNQTYKSDGYSKSIFLYEGTSVFIACLNKKK